MRHLLAIALLFVAVQAHAFEVGWPGNAGEPVTGSCSGCVRSTVNPTGTTPTDVFLAPMTGGTPRSIVYHQKIPNNAGGPLISVRLSLIRATILDPANNSLCFTTCTAVGLANQNANDLDFSACSEVITTTSFEADQWDLQYPTTGTYAPKDTTGTACTLTNCNNAEMWTQVNFLPNGILCTGGITDTIGVMGVYPNYQNP